MVYNTVTDYFVDNRHGIIKDFKENGFTEGQIETAIAAYDFAVNKALEFRASYDILADATKEMVGEEQFKAIEDNACSDFMRIGIAVNEYILAVRSGKKVGYSAIEEE